MYKVIRKNKSYDKRKLVIYDNDNKIVEVEPWGGWFCWSSPFLYRLDEDTIKGLRLQVLKNLYWLVGRDCDKEEWENRIEHWDEGKGVDGKTNKVSQFNTACEKIAARVSFDNK